MNRFPALISFLAIALTAGGIGAAASVPAPKVVLGALKTYDADWTDASKAGFYTIEAKEDGEVKFVKSVTSAANVVAAAKSGSSMYCISTENSGTDAYFFTLNTDNWSMSGTKSAISIDDVPSDLTVDPSTGKLYGGTYMEDPETKDYGFLSFGEFNLSLLKFYKRTQVERYIYAVAADGNGKVYTMHGTRTGSIDLSGYSWDNGLYGIHNTYYPEGYNTMTYDPETGMLYAVVTEREMVSGVKTYKTYLVKINPVTYEYTTIFQFPSQQTYAGLFVMPAVVDTEAPKGVTGASVSFPTITSLEGTVTFTAPTLSVGGAELTENMSVIIQVGSQEYVVTDVVPGSTVTSPSYTFPQGLQTIKLTTANSVDRGESVEIEVFAGEDVPAAVTGLLLNTEGEHPVVSWKAPESGLNGGPIDPAGLTYTVVRQPGNVLLASKIKETSFEDVKYQPALEAISYTVTACTSAGYGEPATTSKVVLGGEWDVPVLESFDSQDAFDLWTIVDMNGYSTWQYAPSTKSAQYIYNEEKYPGDDWLISPAIRLETGKKYVLSYDYRGLYSGMNESFEIMLGTSVRPETMKEKLATHSNVQTGQKHNSVMFSVPDDGKYHLGIHASSPPYQYILEIDNVAIDLMQNGVPGASVLTVTPAEKGALSATVNVILPTEDIEDSPLKGNVNLTVTRSDLSTPVYSAVGMKGGATVTFDDDVEKSATYTYTAIVSNIAGNGPETQATAYIGIDVPDAVQNLTVGEDISGKPVITWEAPVQGRNGGWFDPTTLRYDVYRYFGNLDLIAEKTEASNVTDATLALDDTQELVSYVVIPYAGDAKGLAIASPVYLAGKPYAAPFSETFAKADMDHYPWITYTDEELTQAWTLEGAGYSPNCGDYDGTYGVATFHSASETKKGIGSWFVSPKLSTEGLTVPTLTFALYLSAIPAGAETMQPFVSIAGGDYQPLCEPIARNCEFTGWQLFSFELPAEAVGAEYVRIAFKGVTDGVADMHLDAVKLGELPANPLAAQRITGASRVAVNEPISFEVYVVNNGTRSSEASSVTLTDGTNPTVKSVEPLEPGQRVILEIPYTFTAKGTYTLTAYVGDTHISWQVECVDAVIPGVTDLDCTRSSSGVRLTWDKPSAHGAVTEDFEGMDSWAIDGIGDWSMYDRDMDYTYFINAKVLLPQAPDTYPHATEPKAWQVCDAAELCISEWTEGTPHSGNKMLMAMCNETYVNDDWAVSPRLNGQAQRISVYAKAFTAVSIPVERLQVLVSATDTDPGNFTPLHPQAYLEIPDEWTLLEFDLPEGSKYFALHCVSDAAFALFIDDVSYNDTTVPVLTLSHYEVSRDGQLIATVDTPSYTDTMAPAGKNLYGVKAVYDKGVSAEATAESPELSVVNEITIQDAEPVFTVTGIRVGDTGSLHKLPAGIYVTASGRKILK